MIRAIPWTQLHQCSAAPGALRGELEIGNWPAGIFLEFQVSGCNNVLMDNNFHDNNISNTTD
jgi:hypothetical protein